jgi:hypothetical protein
MGDSINMTTTGLIVTACVIALVVWELIAFVCNKRRALVSTWFQKFGFNNPAAMFSLGALAGHFWMYYRPTMDGEVLECPHCNAKLVVTLNEKTGGYFTEKF